jgi:hypothetical protein
MTGQRDNTSIAVVDRTPAAMDKILSLATTVLNEHTDDAGVCASGSAWPCQSVVLADHNLAGF